MIYILLSHVLILISSASEFSHYYDFLFATSNAFEYASNDNEIKVLNFHTPGIDKYDQLKEKFVSYSLGVNLIDESILQVISKFSPFDDEQRVDILTNCSNVYTIQYHKYFKGTNSSEKQTVQGKNCSSIAYVGDQFIVLCNKPVQQFFIQNGTKIIWSNSQLKINKIQSFFGGLVALSENLFIIYDEQLKFENVIHLNYIQLITTDFEAYILTIEYVFNIQRDGGLNFFHQCQSIPKSLEIIEENVYVQCETLNYFIDWKPYQLGISNKSLSSTFQYLIIDNTEVYDYKLLFQYYKSKTPLYPINFNNQALTIKNNVLYVGEIIGLYLIKVQESIFLDFAIIYDVGSGLQSLHLEEQEIIRVNKKDYFLNYLSGPDIQLVSGAASFEIKKIKINQNVITAFKAQNNHLGFVDQSENMLSLYSCEFQITYDEVKRQCVTLNDFLQVQNNITKSQSLIIPSTNQFMLFILDGNILRLFSVNHNFDDMYDILDFYFGNQILIIIKQSATLIYYFLEDKYWFITSFKFQCYNAVILYKEIILLKQNNTLVSFKFSTKGLYKSYEEQFSEKILSINFVQNQFLVIFQDKILVYQEKILRGKVNLDILGDLQFVQSERNLYIYNQTTVYIFTIQKEITLSSYLYQIIKVEEEIIKLQTLSFEIYEFLLINYDLYIFEALKTFTLISIVEQDLFANEIYYKLIFSNRYNETAELQFRKYGDTLKLKPLECEEIFDINKIEVNKIFDGPIQNIQGDNDIQVIQRVERITTEQFWFNKNVTHILPLPDQDQIIVIIQSEINLCDQTKCQLLFKPELTCRHLEEDYLYFYAICDTSIFRGLKQKPQTIEKLPFTLERAEQHLIKFNDSLILAYEANNDVLWRIYQNYKFKVQIINDIKFNLFEQDKIIAITSKSIIIYDANFIVIKQFEFYPLLKQHRFDFKEEDLYLEDLIKIEGDQYLITTSDILIFEIFIHSDFVEVVRIYNSLYHIVFKKLLLIDSNIFALYGGNFGKQEFYIEFYDRRYYNENKKIIPYFQVLTLTQEIYRYQINVKRITDSKIIVIMAGGDIQEYIIHDYIQILNSTEVANSQQTIKLIASDGDLQTVKNTINIKLYEDTTSQMINMKIIYSIAKQIGIVLIIAILLLIVRQGRRYLILKKQQQGKQFVLQKNQEI